MSQTQSNQTLHSLEALAVLLPSLDGACTTTEDLPPDDALADEALLGLASRLQQALSGWRAQLDQAAALDAQALALARRHAQRQSSSNASANTGASRRAGAPCRNWSIPSTAKYPAWMTPAGGCSALPAPHSPGVRSTLSKA